MTTEEQQACETVGRNITLLLNALSSYQVGLHDDQPDDRKVIDNLWDVREALLIVGRIKKAVTA